MTPPAAHTAELIEFAASKWSDRVAVREEHFSLTFGQLLQHVRWAAAGSPTACVQTGSRVAIWSPIR